MPPGWPLRHRPACPRCSQVWAGRPPALWNSHLQPSGHPLSLHRWGADQTDLHHSGTFLASVCFSYFCPIYVKCHSVLPKEIIVHLTLSSFEIINIWLVTCWSCQRHMSSCSKEPDTESSYAEDVVCLHAQVLAARAHHHHPQQQQRHRVPSNALFKPPANAKLCHPNGGCRFQALINWRIV